MTWVLPQDRAIVERRASQELAGSRAGGPHSRTIEVLAQRGIADRFLAEGQVAQVASFAGTTLDISDFPTRHPYGLGLWQNRIERILAGWVDELSVPIYRSPEVIGVAQDDVGVNVRLSDGDVFHGQYLVGCDAGRSVVRKTAGTAFPGWDPSTSSLIAEVEMEDEPEFGIHRNPFGIHSFGRERHGWNSTPALRQSPPCETSVRRLSPCAGPTMEPTIPPGYPGSPI